MQLGTHRPIRTALTAFTATLLGSSTVSASDSGKIDSSLLIYSESARVKAAEGVFDLSRTLSERRTVGLRLTLDALTGASPNGATPSSQIQTFTGPSGGKSYVADAGKTPLDNTFTDKRIALDGSLKESLDRITFVTVGGHLSLEHDYSSFGINGGISRDFNRRNTTLGVSAAYSHDVVSPIGGAPTPLTSMPPPSANTGEGDGEGEGGGAGPGKGKDTFDGVAGISQVLGRNTIVRLDYSLSRSSGYLNDPYKILSVVQDWNSAAPGEPFDYVYENRPGTRKKQALFGELRRYIAGSTLDLSYRYFWDDWGITSQTADVFLRLPVGNDHALEPHVRWYRQSAADFYHAYLVEGQAFPNFASADSRLAAFDAITYGLKYSWPMDPGLRVSLSAEYYTQMGKRAPPDAIGILRQYDLFPALDAFMVRIGFSYDL
jgi:hypothetical protein